MNQLTDSEFKRLRDFIEKSGGIALGDEKAYLVENRLVGLLADAGCSSYAELYSKAVGNPQSGLRDKIVDAMTTNETSWFRDLYPFQILETVIFKRLSPGTCRRKAEQDPDLVRGKFHGPGARIHRHYPP